MQLFVTHLNTPGKEGRLKGAGGVRTSGEAGPGQQYTGITVPAAATRICKENPYATLSPI